MTSSSSTQRLRACPRDTLGHGSTTIGPDPTLRSPPGGLRLAPFQNGHDDAENRAWIPTRTMGTVHNCANIVSEKKFVKAQRRLCNAK
jgi:hypothetical protein